MRFIFAVLLVAVLSACSGVTKETLGIAKKTPNEKLVEQRAPLSLPPEFNLSPYDKN